MVKKVKSQWRPAANLHDLFILVTIITMIKLRNNALGCFFSLLKTVIDGCEVPYVKDAV